MHSIQISKPNQNDSIHGSNVIIHFLSKK